MPNPDVLMRLTTLSTITVLLLAAASVFAGVTHSVNEENGLRSWRFLERDIEIELVQRLPDQTRALFMNHAFSREVIEQLALSCMFQTIVRNTGASGSGRKLAIDLTGWRLHHEGKTRGLLMKEQLLDSWSEEDASAAARLVIQWGMFPTRQEYLPSDYNWGLTAFGIPPGSTFDVDVGWTEDGKSYTGVIRDVVCAPDVDKLK
jgi:hypothetical protein